MDHSPNTEHNFASALLSDRQLEILLLVGKGLTSKEIGRELAISPSTVDNHVKAAVDRLGARNRHDAARQIAAERAGHRDGVAAASHPPGEGLQPLRPPALGGSPNQLPKTRRLFHIAQIAVLSVIGVSAAILTIVGLVHILSN